MSVKLTCPVCDRAQIEENICPNCETDLSTYRMLAQLPVETLIETTPKRTIPLWFPIAIAILFLVLGISLGFASNSILARQKPSNTPTTTTASITEDELIVSTEIEKSKVESQSNCGGFNYVVRRGDSLSLIASRFYGDSNFWSNIIQANSQLEGRQNSIDIGETLFIPNLQTNCLKN